MTDEQIQKAIVDGIAAALKPVTEALTPLTKTVEEIGKNQRILGDTYAAEKADAAKVIETAKTAAADAAKLKPGEAAKPLTADDVLKLTTDRIDAALKARDDAAKAAAPRESYIADKLKNLPPEFSSKLGSDPTKWAAEEQQLRDQFKAAAVAAGFTAKDVGGGNPGGAARQTPGGAAQLGQYKAAGLSDGEADFASTLKIPA
jgi:hypothetical protein